MRLPGAVKFHHAIVPEIVPALPPAANVRSQRFKTLGARSGPYVSEHEDEAKKIYEATELKTLGVVQLRWRSTTAPVGNTRTRQSMCLERPMRAIVHRRLVSLCDFL